MPSVRDYKYAQHFQKGIWRIERKMEQLKQLNRKPLVLDTQYLVDELLLNYSNRFYNRQFITRKAINHDIITSLDKILNNYFEENSLKNGLPSVKYLIQAGKFKLMPLQLFTLRFLCWRPPYFNIFI